MFCCCDGVVVQRRAAVVLSFRNVVVSRWSSIVMAQHLYVVTLWRCNAEMVQPCVGNQKAGASARLVGNPA
jgi:hypothetical protein